MVTKPIAWSISENKGVTRLENVTPEYEKDLEDWIEQDPAIVDDDLLLIGRQCTNDFNTCLDLLGLNSVGDLVIIELKRKETLREMVAQALEYAAWASRLSYEDIIGIATRYKAIGSRERLEAAFRERFGTDMPDTVNETQKIFLVAPEITEGIRTVVEYLAETYEMPINAITFGMVQIGGHRMLMRDAVLTEGETDRHAASKRKPAATPEELLAIGRENGVGEIIEYLWALHPHFRVIRYWRNWNFILKSGRSKLAIVAIYPNRDGRGKVRIAMNAANLAELFGRSLEHCREFIAQLKKIGHPEPSGDTWDYLTLTSLDEARRFVKALGDFMGVPLEPVISN